MSKITIALESAVATVLENSPRETPQTSRQRANIDRAFAQILKLIAPRIRHFVRQYGLVAHWEDAEQCCAIAVHRAIQSYDPAKAQFTTFVNWQIRGELQSLRFRLMTDQRPSAKKVEATTVSLNVLVAGGDSDEHAPELLIEDEHALARTEATASHYLADGAMSALIDAYVEHLRKVAIEQMRRRPRAKRAEAAARLAGPRLRTALSGIDPAELAELDGKLAREREIVERRLFETGTLDDVANETGVTKERVRQITKRAAHGIAEIAASDPRFAVMAEASERPARRSTPKLLPDPRAVHNRLAQVREITPAEAARDDDALVSTELVAADALITAARLRATLH